MTCPAHDVPLKFFPPPTSAQREERVGGEHRCPKPLCSWRYDHQNGRMTERTR